MNSAKIIAITQPLITTDGNLIRSPTQQPMGIDEFVAYVARVSNPSNQANAETSQKLLKYLAKHKHWSPFEMVNVVMEIVTTRDIGRQILRHRSFSFQEFSQRYADPTIDLGFELREARLQDPKNRQNSIKTDDLDIDGDWFQIQDEVLHVAENAYKKAIALGIAKEQARAVLPEGLTQSRMYMNGSLRSWITYIMARAGKGTQAEHIVIALSAADQLKKYFPALSNLIDSAISD